MRKKILVCLITLLALGLIASTAYGPKSPMNAAEQKPIHKVTGVNLKDAKHAGGLTITMKITLPDGTERPGSRGINIAEGESAESKAEKLQAAANDIIKNDLKCKGSSDRKKNGKQVTFKLPASLNPQVEVDSDFTGEEEKAMSKKQIDDFYKASTAPVEEQDATPIEGEEPASPRIVTDETTTNANYNSMFLGGAPLGTWNGPSDGMLNVSVGADNYSTPTMGKTLDMLATEILTHYTDLGYTVFLTGDPMTGFYIDAGYYTVSVEALDNGMIGGVRLVTP